MPDLQQPASAGRDEETITHRVRFRWREGVTGAMRLACGLRRFRIKAATDPVGDRRDLVCLVEEISA